MITMQDIEKAEAQETATRKRVEVLRRQHGIDGGEAVERERRNVDELRTRKARQDQALEERKAALKPHSAELKRLASGLDKSASAVAEAAQEAMEALRRLVAATGAHGAAVQAAHGRLEELGLPLADAACGEYQEGAGYADAVRLGDRMYGPVPADVVVAETVARLARVEFAEHHPLAQASRTTRNHTVAQSAAGRELFSRLPAA